MKFRIGPRESLIFGGKRIVNNTRHTVELLVLDEPGRHIVHDDEPYPYPQKTAPAAARTRPPKVDSAVA